MNLERLLLTFGYGYSSEVIPNPFDSEGDFEVKFATIEPFAINELYWRWV